MTADETGSRFFIPTYRRLAPHIDHGEGVYLYDTDGRKYLDFFGGLAVNALGYTHPAIMRALTDQMSRYNHVSNYFLENSQVTLAEGLLRHSGFDRIFFCNSGTEATEAALKLARKWGSEKGKTDVIGFSGGFHGRTMGALSVMDNAKYREGYGPFLDGCFSLPFNDGTTARAKISQRTAAVILECIQGEAGVIHAEDAFLETLLDLKQEYGFLLIADEIQTGFGRTGAFSAYEHTAIRPDMVTMAKAIGGGLPLGALLVREDLAAIFGLGGHGTTFGGNPLACAAGAAALEVMQSENLLEHIRVTGAYLHNGLSRVRDRFPAAVTDVRGKGFIAALELAFDGGPVMKFCLDNGLLINLTHERILRFLPPYIIDRSHVDYALEILQQAVSASAS